MYQNPLVVAGVLKQGADGKHLILTSRKLLADGKKMLSEEIIK
jgi:hypothetical protein